MNVESSHAGAYSLPRGAYTTRRVRHPRWAHVLFTVLVAGLLGPATADAVTIRVPAEHVTIQAGINASTHGDTVLVAAGIYTGDGNRDIQFHGRRIVVRSEAGAESTIIDCEGTAEDPHRGFHFGASETNESVLQGFTIRNGYAVPGSPGSQAGAGIRVHGLSQGPLIEDCIVTQCTGASAVHTYAVRTILRRCSIVDNESKGVQLESAWLMEDCLISGNISKGVDLVYGEVLRSTIVGNDGCGVYVQSNEFAVIRDCLIAGNGRVGITASYTTGLLIEGCTIVGNDGPAGITGGVWLDNDNQWTTIRRSILRGNCPNDVLVPSHSDVTFECCAIDPSAVTGSGNVTYDGPQVTGDPLLCFPVDCEQAPTTEGDYHLQSVSPCLPENSPCGTLIGALGEGCEVSSSPGPLEGGGGDPASQIWVETWPNPARDAVSMRLAIREESKSGGLDLGIDGKSLIEIRVFTASGSECRRALRVLQPLESPVEIDTRDLKPGVYFVRMRTGTFEASGRFLIAR